MSDQGLNEGAARMAGMGLAVANRSRIDRLRDEFEKSELSLRSARRDLEVEQGRVAAAERNLEHIRKLLEAVR